MHIVSCVIETKYISFCIDKLLRDSAAAEVANNCSVQEDCTRSMSRKRKVTEIGFTEKKQVK